MLIYPHNIYFTCQYLLFNHNRTQAGESFASHDNRGNILDNILKRFVRKKSVHPDRETVIQGLDPYGMGPPLQQDIKHGKYN